MPRAGKDMIIEDPRHEKGSDSPLADGDWRLRAGRRRRRRRRAAAVSIDADDIGGGVTGASGPEAGVWVIAETSDLGTK